MKFSVLLIAIVSTSLIGCSSKPPACSDEKTLGLINKIFINELTESFSSIGLDSNTSANYANIIKSGTTLRLNNVRTNGYDDNAKKYTCAATAEVVFNSSNQRIPNAVASVKEIIQKIESLGDAYDPFSTGFRNGFLNSLAVRSLGEYGDAQLNESMISGDISYSSTFSESSDKETQHYIEVKGILPIANYAKSVFSMYGFTDREKQASPEAHIDPPTTDTQEVISDNESQGTQPTEQQMIFATSYDCSKATTNVELMICHNDSLADTDIQLSKIYKKALSITKEKEQLRKEQEYWRINHRDKCTDNDCILNSYSDRINFILSTYLKDIKYSAENNE